MADVIIPVVDEARPLHTVELSLDGGGKTPVLVDRERLSQVVRHALLDAIRLSPEDQPVSLACAVEGQDVVISVSGRRTRQRAAKVITGHALGQHLSEQIVLGHGGRISTAAVRDGGTTVRIAIPVARKG